MNAFEYTAIPAPIRSEKAKSAKTPAERYALTLTDEINRMAADGWEYLRAETLPSEERSGLTGRTTLFHNLLIFRRPRASTPKPRALTQAEAKPTTASTDTHKRNVDTATSPAAKTKVEEGVADPATSPIFSEPMRIADRVAERLAEGKPKT